MKSFLEKLGTAMVSGNLGTGKSVLMNDVQVTGATLRSTELATQTGGRATIGSMIGEDGKAVVIFLRHLG